MLFADTEKRFYRVYLLLKNLRRFRPQFPRCNKHCILGGVFGRDELKEFCRVAFALEQQ